MTALITSGAVPIALLILTAAEFLLLLIFHRKLPPRLKPINMLPTILAGDCLIFAWLSTLRHAPWPITAACLLGALANHLADIARRLK